MKVLHGVARSMMRVRAARARVLLATGVLVCPVAAVAQGVRPVTPDTLRPELAGMAPLTRALAGQERSHVTRIGDFQVMLTGPVTARVMDSLSRGASAATPCATVPSTAPRTMDDGTTPANDAGGYLVLSAVMLPYEPGCVSTWNETSTAMWRGEFVGRGLDAEATPHSLRLKVDGRPVKPRAAVRRTAWRRGDTGALHPLTLTEYYFPAAALDMPANGRSPRLTIEVWPARGDSLVAEVDSLVSSALVYEEAAWRLASVPSTIDGRIALAPVSPPPAAVAEAVALARQSSLAGAVQAAQLLSASTGRTDADWRPLAKMLVAEGLLALGDSAGARGVVIDAAADRPCLAAPAGSSSFVQSTAAGLRSSPSCAYRPMTGVLTRGLLAPGLGHAGGGHGRLGLIPAAIVSAFALHAVEKESVSRRRYADYLASTDYTATGRLVEESRASRRDARVSVLLAASVWVGDAMLSLLNAWDHNRLVKHGRL